MRKIISALLIFSCVFTATKVFAKAKGVTKFRKDTNIPLLTNSTGTGFTISKKDVLRFSSDVQVGRSTGSVFLKGDQTLTAGDVTGTPYLRFKLPPVKKKKKKGGKGSKSKGTNVTSSKNKTTRTIGITFYTENFSRLTNEKVYSVKKFKKRRTAKRGQFAGIFKDGRQALGRFKIKTNNN